MIEKELALKIHKAVENALYEKYAPNSFEYESEVRDAINELEYLKNDENCLLLDEIIENVERELDIDFCDIEENEDDFDYFYDIVIDEVDDLISCIHREAEVEDDLSSNYYNEDGDFDSMDD